MEVQFIKGLARCISLTWKLVSHQHRNLPELATAYALRGTAYHNLKRYGDAVIDLSIAVERNPQFTFAYKYRADALLAMERFEEALDNYSQAIELQVSDNGLYSSRASAFRKAGHLEDALSNYSIANELIEDDNYSGFLEFYFAHPFTLNWET